MKNIFEKLGFKNTKCLILEENMDIGVLRKEANE